MDPFAQQAARYVITRPMYPRELINKLFASTRFKRNCLDLCCGSGQLTQILTENFTQVLGVDRSEEQLKRAPRKDRIKYDLCKDASNLK